MKRKALDREFRKGQILLRFAVELQAARDAEMTIAVIARHLDLSPSDKLRRIVHELVDEGCLGVREEPIPGIAKFRRVYFLLDPEGQVAKSDKANDKRAIVINCKQGSFFEVLDK